MELQQLKYFKTVANIGKISEAAEALFVSAPALSTSISRLEKELGVQLFDRTGNRIRLNAQGQIFLKYTNQIFSSLDNAKQELSQSMLREGPHVSIISINSGMWTNPITAFTSKFPSYTLSCTSISLLRLANEGLPPHHAFFLTYEKDLPPGYSDELDSIFLFQAYPAAMVHKDHPLADRETLDIPTLSQERLFLTEPGSPLQLRLSQLFEYHNLPYPADNSYPPSVRQKMVLDNMGISFYSMHPDNVPLPGIRYIPIVDPLQPWNARLYWRKDRAFTEYETAFKDFIVNYYHDLHKV